MRGSIQRVRDVIHGRVPDRAPLFELIRNDAVISHFAGRELSVENAEEVVFAAYEPAVDATRPAVRLPRHETTETLADGRRRRHFRWTAWTERVRYADFAAYAAAKRKLIDSFETAWTDVQQRLMDTWLASIADHRRRLGEVFFFPGGRGVGLMGIFGEVGLEQFSYYLADCGEVMDELLECNTVAAETWVAHLPADHGLEAVFVGDDIAFKSGPLLSPKWLAEHYFSRLARVTAAWHAKGIRVLFHSDGNLMPILDRLVESGIDGLNPIEVMAGMDVGVIHARHPKLWMTGGIDVSQLLPFAGPQQVKDAVKRTLDAAEGRIMIGSSTELQNTVPLANFLAMREAVLDYAC
ncbi:MAG: uroporphyrinogen decarboxylase family protein [Planctomycetota bacterium]